MVKAVPTTMRVSSMLFAIGLPIVWEFEGYWGAFGLALGFATAALSVFSFGMLALALQNDAKPEPNRAVAMSSVLWLVKLPLIAGFTYEASIRGMPTVGCFLGGLALVYCVLIGLAYVDSKSSG